MGCDIAKHEDYSFNLSQARILSSLDEQILIHDAGNKGHVDSTSTKATSYSHVTGKMLLMGRMSTPLMLLHDSIAVGKLADLRCHHLRAFAAVVKRLKAQPDELHFILPPPESIQPFVLDILSDGVTSTKGEGKCRSGHIIFRRHKDIVHPIHWSARLLQPVSRSSGTAKILSAADAMSNGWYLQAILAEVRCAAPAALTVDSTSLISLSLPQ